jgi:hypothetical protein
MPVLHVLCLLLSSYFQCILLVLVQSIYSCQGPRANLIIPFHLLLHLKTAPKSDAGIMNAFWARPAAVIAPIVELPRHPDQAQDILYTSMVKASPSEKMLEMPCIAPPVAVLAG